MNGVSKERSRPRFFGASPLFLRLTPHSLCCFLVPHSIPLHVVPSVLRPSVAPLRDGMGDERNEMKVRRRTELWTRDSSLMPFSHHGRLRFYPLRTPYPSPPVGWPFHGPRYAGSDPTVGVRCKVKGSSRKLSRGPVFSPPPFTCPTFPPLISPEGLASRHERGVKGEDTRLSHE